MGATPQNTPALYSLMNYADISLGTWYPMGGMHMIVKGMASLAEELGVKILTSKEVTGFTYEGKNIKEVVVGDENHAFDVWLPALTTTMLIKTY